MKVIEINATYGYGSTGLIAFDIGNMLMAQGDEVRYMYQMGDCSSTMGYQVGTAIDWKFHALYSRLFGKQGWASRSATRSLFRYLDTEKPDVVHLHNLHANYINLPLLLQYLAEKDIPTVVTLHDCWFFTGKCCHFASVGCERWKTGCGHCLKQKEEPRSLFFDRSSQIAMEKARLFSEIPNLTVVGCSKWIASLAKESFVFKNCHVEQIYNGVDTDIFVPMPRDKCKKALRISAKYIMLGMANKWLDQKNKAVFDSVVSEFSENEVLVLVGCSEIQKTELKNMPNVVPIGFIKDRKLLAEYYNIADAFVNLTFEDTLPTVNMEALACGTPVITYVHAEVPNWLAREKQGRSSHNEMLRL